MNKRQAIVNLIERRGNGYTPHHFDLTQRIVDRLASHYHVGPDQVEDTIGNHFLYVNFTAPGGNAKGFSNKTNKSGVTEDEFGIIWDSERLYDIGDWAMVDHPIHDLSLSGYAFPDGTGEGRYLDAATQMEAHPGRFNVLLMTGLLDTCWHLTGLEDFLAAMLEEEAIAHRLLDHAVEYIVNVIRGAPPQLDAVRFLEDWGTQNGLLISRKLWKKYLEPRLRVIHEAVRKKRLYVMRHSCGDITELFPDIIALGVDIIDAIQPEVMDIRFLKKEYGKDIVFFGGIGTQSTLPFGSVDDVIREAEETIHALGAGGGYVAGPAGAISTDTPIENVASLAAFCMKLKERGQ